jgi:uncharacterized membrane protein HdeD (DUF308 family)
MEEEKKKDVEASEPKKPIDISRGSVLWSVWNFLEATLFVVGGILAIVFCKNTDLQSTILIIVGAFLIADGVLKTLANFLPIFGIEDKAALTHDLVVAGAMEIALGITAICDIAKDASVADAITGFISMFIGIVLLVVGTIAIAYSLAILLNKYLGMTGVSILGMIFGALMIALGVVVIVKMSDAATFNMVVLIIAGIALIFAGIVAFATTVDGIKEHQRKVAIHKAANEVKATYTEQTTAETTTDDTNSK